MAQPIVCPACHHENDPWRKHCGGCGSGLPGGCPACSTVNRANDRFCGSCARPLRVSRTASHHIPPPDTQTMPIDVLELLPDSTRRG